VIAAFARAHNARSTIALQNVYPTLTGPDFAALERMFLEATDYRLTLTDVNVQVQGGVAQVRARASRLITRTGGDPRTVNGTAAFELKKEPSGWIITRAMIPERSQTPAQQH
jgi:ketosteroid isomerase-like protein